MSKIGVAVVGVGGWGGVPADAICANNKFELVAWYDTAQASIEDFQRKTSIPPSCSYEEMLDNPDIEAVVISVPNYIHASVAVQAAGRGKHVWIEKPLANTVAEADEIIQACEDSGVILQVGHCLRRYPCIRQAKKMVEDGVIGNLVAIEGHQSHRGGFGLTPEKWRWYADKCPGGPMNVLGVHQIDAMHYIMGPSAEVSGMFVKKYMPYEADEITAVLIKYKNGLLGTLLSTYITPGRTFISIYGTEGYLGVNFGGTLTHHHRNGTVTDIPVDSCDVFQNQFEEFADCILKGRKPETGGPEGRAAVAVLESALISSRTGKTITL